MGARTTESDDVDAYDLILKDKESLLLFPSGTDNEETRRKKDVRFIFSHSALSEGWDNPNVFVICTLKHSDSSIRKRQEVGRGLRICVNQNGERVDSGANIHDAIAATYHEAKKNNTLVALPPELAPYAPKIAQLIDSVFSDAALPAIDDGRKAKPNPLNANLEKAEFKALWEKINRKAAYTVHFDTAELIKKCVTTLDKELRVTKLQYTIERGEQNDAVTYDELRAGQGFHVKENETGYFSHSVHSAVKYDLIGKVAENTYLTRATVAEILKGMEKTAFSQYRMNPEDFMQKASILINEQKATVVVEHLTYSPVEETHKLHEIFTVDKKPDFSRAIKTEHHVYDYVFTDSKNEKAFVTELDKSVEVVVYAKLPRGFFIPTPVGNYNPDWAIAFKEGAVKHIYFVAETKGTMSSMELKKIEITKIDCARKFFTGITTDQVKYDVVSDYAKLMNLVK